MTPARIRQHLVNRYLVAERDLLQASPNAPLAYHDAYWAAHRAVVAFDKGATVTVHCDGKPDYTVTVPAGSVDVKGAAMLRYPHSLRGDLVTYTVAV